MNDFGERIQILSIQAVPFIMAIVFHEYAHGAMAKRFGDTTAKDAGRLTLNPIPHLDPIGTFIPLVSILLGIPLLFGWAKPVPIDPRRFSKFRPGLFWVAAAGPGMNAILALFSAIIFCSIRLFVPEKAFFYEPLSAMALVSVSLNYSLGIFNLLPLPPLDGSKIIESMLPLELARKYERLAQYSFWILIALLFTGALNVLRAPITFATEETVYGVAAILSRLTGVPL